MHKKTRHFQNEMGPEQPTHCIKVITSRNHMHTFEMIPWVGGGGGH